MLTDGFWLRKNVLFRIATYFPSKFDGIIIILAVKMVWSYREPNCININYIDNYYNYHAHLIGVSNTNYTSLSNAK